MYQVSFENYLRYLGEGIDADNAFRRAFGTNAVPAIENHWRRWARTQLPDAVTVAAARMTFLGEALAYKSSRKEKQPKNLKQLQADLQQRGFAITRTVHELDLELRADQPELYTYTRPGGEVSKFLLARTLGLRPAPPNRRTRTHTRTQLDVDTRRFRRTHLRHHLPLKPTHSKQVIRSRALPSQDKHKKTDPPKRAGSCFSLLHGTRRIYTLNLF